jgi:O-antigen ligase
MWPGYVKGAELSLLDIVAIALLLSLPKGARPFKFKFGVALFMIAVGASSLQSDLMQPALFLVWQLARVLLVAVVVSRAVSFNGQVAYSILNGMAAALLLATGIAIWQRFVGGVLQAGGSFGHQNFLGMVSHFVTLPFLAVLLGGAKGWRPYATPALGGLIAALTVSRATIGLIGLGYALVLVTSLMRGWSLRKSLVAILGLAAALLISPLILSSLQQRLGGTAFFEPDLERLAFEQVSTMMLSDRPLGIGANQWVVVANTSGYSDRAGVSHAHGSRSAHVHNVYWLVAAETGYLGLLAFVVMLIHPLVSALRESWRRRGQRSGDLLLGLGVTLAIVYLHSSLEWILISFQVQYLLGVTMGLISGIITQDVTASQQTKFTRRKNAFFTVDEVATAATRQA